MNLLKPAALAFALGLLVLGAGALVHAQDSVETAKKHELDEIRRQAALKRQQAAALKPKETRALGELRRTERELTATHRRLSRLQGRKQELGVRHEVTRASQQTVQAAS